MTCIVVGIDGSENSVAALQWAVEEAKLRNTTVRAVNAWEYPYVATAPSPIGFPVPPAIDMQDTAEQVLGGVVQQAQIPPGVVVERVVYEGSPAKVLLDEAAKDGELLVIGARGRGGFIGLLLGSVATQVVHHAEVPTVVVRADGRDRSKAASAEEAR
jgi:nucleotide-binding universal stress UspA family protein